MHLPIIENENVKGSQQFHLSLSFCSGDVREEELSPAQEYDAFTNQSSLVALANPSESQADEPAQALGPWKWQGPLSPPQDHFPLPPSEVTTWVSMTLGHICLQPNQECNFTLTDAGTQSTRPNRKMLSVQRNKPTPAVTVSEALHCPALESARGSRAVSCTQGDVPMPLGGPAQKLVGLKNTASGTFGLCCCCRHCWVCFLSRAVKHPISSSVCGPGPTHMLYVLDVLPTCHNVVDGTHENK